MVEYKLDLDIKNETNGRPGPPRGPPTTTPILVKNAFYSRNSDGAYESVPRTEVASRVGEIYYLGIN